MGLDCEFEFADEPKEPEMAMQSDDEMDSQDVMTGTGMTSSTRPSSSNLLKHLTALKQKGKLSAMSPLDKRKKKSSKSESTTSSKVSVNKVAKALQSSPKDKSAKQRKSNKGSYVFKKL